jgi:tetratricopeptide (TPR) repeat protein
MVKFRQGAVTRKFVKGTLLSGALFLCAACTTTTETASEPVEVSVSARLYGDYLAASYASYLNDAGARSNYYSRAFAMSPADLELGRRAMTSALTAGDEVLTRTLAIEVLALDKDDELARMILGAHALSNGKYKKADEILSVESERGGLRAMTSLLAGWAKVGAGDEDAALQDFDIPGDSKYFQIIGTLQKAQVYAQLSDKDKADAAFLDVVKAGVSPIEAVLAQSRAALARDDRPAALKLLTDYADKNGGALTGPVRTFMDGITAKEDVQSALTPQQAASRALVEPAFAYYGRARQYDASEVFLRLALQLDPTNDKARLFLGTILEEIDRKDEALALYTNIDTDSSYGVSARLSEANILFEKDKNEEAIRLLDMINKNFPSRVTQSALGRGYLIEENYEAALPVYNALIKGMSAEEIKDNPNAIYLRGICLERLGRWQEAVTDFQTVLKHQSENADALNYLGYTWVDKGVHLDEAFDMIRKAVKLDPNSGAIVDSLGWAHYKLGQYSQARIRLEEAAEKSPASATIIDHLGDVYWKLGRYREAGYQWQRARELDPTDEELKTILAKLKHGLSASVAHK